MNLYELKQGDKIEYIGDSLGYGGKYTLRYMQETYVNKEDCPKHERDMLIIIEFMNDGTPMFIPIDTLNSNEWKLITD